MGMSYQQTLDYLYSQLPMFTRIGAAAYKKDLHNTLALLKALDNPEKKLKTVHIAGTNGKGSTSHMLAAVFHANGYKTGLYTSPHLKDFRERIKTTASAAQPLQMISEAFVVDFVARTKSLIENIEPSFFELTVAMAFDYFDKQQIDIAIIETGLGGRLDSTNVIAPELSIITNIGWDHMNLLGNTLAAIASEKAGIIKPKTPVVIGETNAETKRIFEAKAAQEQAPIFFAETLPSTWQDGDDNSAILNVEIDNIVHTYQTDLTGSYQQANLRTVAQAIQILQTDGWKLDGQKTRYALSHVVELSGLHGRWEILHQNPKVIADVAHNEDGIGQVLKQASRLQPATEKIHFILGMAKDKEVEKVLQLFPAGARYSFTNAHIPRALAANELQLKAATFHLAGNCFDDVNKAIRTAISSAQSDDLIIVCGSVFVIAETDETLFTSQELHS